MTTNDRQKSDQHNNSTIPAVEQHRRYAKLKSDWVDAHPQATPTEYDQAIRAIAEKCGI